MARRTYLPKREALQICAAYRLPKLVNVRRLPETTEDGPHVLETNRGKFLVNFVGPKSEIEVKREVDLLTFLSKHDLPCPVPLTDDDGHAYRESGARQVVVRKKVDGHPVALEEMTPGQLENIGRMMGELHLVGKAYKKGVDNRFGFDRVAEVYIGVRELLPHYLKKIVRTLDEEIEYLRNYLETKLPKGVIHGDLVAEQVRFKGERVVEVHGFESAARGKFILDLATVVNTLCYEDGAYSLKRFESMIAGYESLRTLSLAEWDAFPNELRFSAFRFTVTRLRDFFATPAEDRGRINKDFQEYYERLRVLRRERDGGMEAMLMAMATGYDYRKYQKVKAGERRSR